MGCKKAIRFDLDANVSEIEYASDQMECPEVLVRSGMASVCLWTQPRAVHDATHLSAAESIPHSQCRGELAIPVLRQSDESATRRSVSALLFLEPWFSDLEINGADALEPPLYYLAFAGDSGNSDILSSSSSPSSTRRTMLLHRRRNRQRTPWIAE